jgi:hypothetical protein
MLRRFVKPSQSLARKLRQRLPFVGGGDLSYRIPDLSEAEIALRGVNKASADHEESFRRIVDQAENATRLVDDLLARIDAVMRRSSLKLEEEPCLRGGGIEFDCSSLRVTVNGSEVHMTSKELVILELLMSNPWAGSAGSLPGS